MKFYSSLEERMLYPFSKKDVGWLCTEPHSFQKKCATKCWFHQFFLELCWVIKGNNFLSCVEFQAIVNRLINEYKKENEQDYYFSRGEIDSLMVDIEQNWKLCLLDFEVSPFIF